MKRGFFNVSTGIVNQIITIILGLIIPRMFIMSFGSEVNGLVSTIGQIFMYFTIFEAGVLTVSLQALYGPVAKDNKKDINGIISATNIFCKRIGIVYTLAMAVFAVVFPLVVDTDIPVYDIVLLIILQGMSGVLNYFFVAKYKCLMSAEGKEYINNGLTMLYNTGANILRIVFLLLGFDVIVVQSSYVIVFAAQVIIMTVYINRKYRWLDLKTKPDLPALSQKGYALIHQISALIFNNTDTIIISVILGFAASSVYSIYNMIFVALGAVITSVMGGIQYKLGQLFNVDRERYPGVLDCCETYYLAIVFTIFTVAYILTVPFLKLYTAGMDINYIDEYLPLLFVIINLLSSGRSFSCSTINFAGHFAETKWRTIAESVINIAVSVAAVQFIGIYGVLCGTIVALLYRTNDMIIYSNRKLLGRSPMRTYSLWLGNFALFTVIVLLSQNLELDISNYLWFVVYAILILVVVAAMYFGLSVLLNRRAFDVFRKRYGDILRGRFHR